jgi:hypothetical protein
MESVRKRDLRRRFLPEDASAPLTCSDRSDQGGDALFPGGQPIPLDMSMTLLYTVIDAKETHSHTA